MITGIIPFGNGNQRVAGSTYLRVNGLTNNTKDFKIWKHGHKYDNLIFQKNYWTEMMEHFKGPKILDLCDPDWVNGTVDLMEVGNIVDAITCSSLSLTQLIQTYFPRKIVAHIPDRLDFNLFPPTKKWHTGRATKIIWFGYIANAYETLEQFVPVLKKNRLTLIIIADKPYDRMGELSEVETDFIPYHPSSAYSHIQMGDIVINAKSEKAFFKYKSNNKTLISWKLGIPVAETPSQLEKLLDAKVRNDDVSTKKPIVESYYDIGKSAEQYREILHIIKRSPKYFHSIE